MVKIKKLRDCIQFWGLWVSDWMNVGLEIQMGEGGRGLQLRSYGNFSHRGSTKLTARVVPIVVVASSLTHSFTSIYFPDWDGIAGFCFYLNR